MHSRLPVARRIHRSYTEFARLLSTGAALWLAAGALGFAHAADFTISDDRTETNGGNTNRVNGEDSFTVTETGSIDVTTGAANISAIHANGANNVIVNRGELKAGNTDGKGLRIQNGTNNSFTNEGNIDASRQGVFVVGGSGNTITNLGTINMGENGGRGIQLDNSSDNTVTNRNTITVTGDQSIGIYIEDFGAIPSGNAVANYGLIDMTGAQTRGLMLEGTNNTAINWGTILVDGNAGYGMVSFKYRGNGDNITLINHGDILVSGANVTTGIGVTTDDSTAINWGTIRAEFRAYGMTIDGSGNEGVNWGSITSDTRNAMWLLGDQNTAANWGELSSGGLGYETVRIEGANHTFINGGKIVNTGGRNAITVGSRSATPGVTLEFHAPAFVGGRIDVGDDGTEINITTGPSQSVLWELDGTVGGGMPTVTGPYAGFYNEDTQQFATYDPTALAGTVNQFGHMQGLLSGIGRSGLARTESAHVQIADNTGQTASDAGGVLPWDGRAWAGVFGGFYDHDGDHATLDRDIDLKGFAAGYSARPMAGLTVAAMAGYLRGSQEADAKYAPSYRLDSTGLFAGANGRMEFNLFDLDIGLTGGRVSYDSDRFINDNLGQLGESWATASFDGWFVIPEVGVSTSFEWTDIVTVRPSARVSYAYQHIDSYQESGSRADANVDGRTLSLLTGTAELAFEKQLFDMVTVNAVGGYTKRLNVGDDAVSMQLVNVTNEVEIGDTDSAAFYAGGGVSVDIVDHVSLAVEARTYLNGDFKGNEGHARVSIAF